MESRPTVGLILRTILWGLIFWQATFILLSTLPLQHASLEELLDQIHFDRQYVFGPLIRISDTDADVSLAVTNHVPSAVIAKSTGERSTTFASCDAADGSAEKP